MWLYGASPMLSEGKLYLQILQSNPPPYGHAKDDKPDRESFLLCQDPATGKNLRRKLRPTDALEESQEAYSTPIPFEEAGKPAILVIGADYLTAHLAETGAELWRGGGLDVRRERHWRLIPSPVVAGEMIIACGPLLSPGLWRQMIKTRTDGGNRKPQALSKSSIESVSWTFCLVYWFIESPIVFASVPVAPLWFRAPWSSPRSVAAPSCSRRKGTHSPARIA